MKTPEKLQPIEDDEMLDDYGHLPFKRAGNRFAKYRNAPIFVIDADGQRHELCQYERKLQESGKPFDTEIFEALKGSIV